MARNSAAMEKVWAEIWEARAPADEGGDWPELPTTPPAPLRAMQERCEVPLAALVRPVKLRGARAKGAFVVLIVMDSCVMADDENREDRV